MSNAVLESSRGTSRRLTIKSASATIPTPRLDSVAQVRRHASGVRQNARSLLRQLGPLKSHPLNLQSKPKLMSRLVWSFTTAS